MSAVELFRDAIARAGDGVAADVGRRAVTGLARALRAGARELDGLATEVSALLSGMGRRDLEVAWLGALSSLEAGRGNEAGGLRAARDAVRLARRGADAALEGEALRQLGHVHLRFGRPREAERALARCVDLLRGARRDGLLGGALIGLATVRASVGDFHGARRRVVAGLRAVERAADRAETLRGLLLLARVEVVAGRFSAAAHVASRAFRLARKGGDARIGGLALGYAAWAASERGHAAAAERLAARALDMVRPLGDAGSLAANLALLARIRIDTGRLDEARAGLDEAERLDRASGRSLSAAQCTAFRALLAFRAGDLAAARAGARLAQKAFSVSGPIEDFADASLLLAEVYLALGRTGLARRELLGVRAALLSGTGLARASAMVDVLCARARRAREAGPGAYGPLTRAVSALSRSGSVDERIAAGLEEAALASPDRRADALGALARRARAARRPFLLASVLIALGRLPARAPVDAIRDLEEAREIARSSGFRLLLSEATEALAAHAARLGRRGAAAKLSREASERRAECLAGIPPRLLTSSAARAVSSRAGGGDATAPSGSRSPPDRARRDSFAASGVSAGEAAVLAALAEGLSNKEIARRLFISTATVRTHLRNIFRKLGVASRLEAVVAWRRRA